MNEPGLTAHTVALSALVETNPRAHAALSAAGCTVSGHPALGLVGWLPPRDLLDVCRAVHLGHSAAGTEGWTYEPADVTAAGVRSVGTWLHPRGPAEVRRIRNAVLGWGKALGLRPGDSAAAALLVVLLGEPMR